MSTRSALKIKSIPFDLTCLLGKCFLLGRCNSSASLSVHCPPVKTSRSFANVSCEMNHFQRLNEVKELKIFFFAQRANTRKQASSRRSLPCDAWAPTAQNRASAVRERHVSTQKTGSYITERSRLPGLIVGPCPSEESLCCPACPPPPPFLFADSRPPISKVRVLFPCVCSPTVCIIRSITSLSLATTTWTPEHPFFSTHCYPSTSSDITCVLGGGSFPVNAHGFSSRGVAAVRARRLFPSTISGVRGSVPVFLWVEN